ncbi:hypothetical protein H0H81_006571 [Sphagnurus paluster]|uniref:Uncharacterized protein n=1 Tax=Sphagnurus paluster TaxID=117069 RepID=A0A9P7GP28_9AGAR|nr:hypothetical protein H0H81_006571 [Sphagnurus paluster]
MDSQEHGFPEVKSGTSNPKRFSFPQTMQQLDNTHPRGMVAHPESYKAFHRAQGEPQKRQPIFPALQRFQKNPIQPHSQNQSHHQQQPQRPFFSLLQAKPFTPAPKDRYFMQEQLNGRNMKIEELSDKTPSSPPSATPPKLLPAPQHQIISPFSPGPHISTLRGQHHPQPYQILPPPPPPLGPTSHPTSHEKFREASTREEISIGVEDSKFHGNADPADLPDIAIKALRQVQVANAELAEERHRSKTLTAELAALRISHEALTDQHATVQQDLQATREQVETSQRQLEAAVKERDLSQVRLAEIKENAGKMKKDFAELGESYTGLRTGFEQLKVLYEKAEVKSRELAEAKKYATDGLQGE